MAKWCLVTTHSVHGRHTTVTDTEEALLAQLADLKALVSGTVDQARDVESLRTVIRQLFERVIVREWSWQDLEAAGIVLDEGLFLVPVLREDAIDWSSDALAVNRAPLPGELTLPTCL